MYWLWIMIKRHSRSICVFSNFSKILKNFAKNVYNIFCTKFTNLDFLKYEPIDIRYKTNIRTPWCAPPSDADFYYEFKFELKIGIHRAHKKFWRCVFDVIISSIIQFLRFFRFGHLPQPNFISNFKKNNLKYTSVWQNSFEGFSFIMEISKTPAFQHSRASS